MRVHLVAALVLAAGCDGLFHLNEVTGGPPDAMADAADAPVVGDPCLPSAVVPPAIRVQGIMADASNSAGIKSLSIDAMPGGSAVTDVMGMYAIDFPTNQMPLDISLTTSGVTAYPTHRIYYQRPFTAGTSDGSNKLLSTATIATLYTARSQVPNTATALVALRDCAGNGVPGATISFEGQQILYQGGGSSTDGTGVAYALDIPAGPHTVTSTATADFPVTTGPNEMTIVYLVSP